MLELVENSVVFLMPDNIEAVLRDCGWPSSTWEIANVFLGAVGAERLGADAVGLVGISEETTCYVTPRYFETDRPFEDYVVHEVAHIFHNCKRRTAALLETRRKEWLLDIAYGKTETFAYSCEAFSFIAGHPVSEGSSLRALRRSSRCLTPGWTRGRWLTSSRRPRDEGMGGR